MRRSPAPRDFDGWISQLGVDSCRRRARAHLMECGAEAVPALRRGLHHLNPTVRRVCVNLLDRFVDDQTLPALVAALDDPDHGVRARVLHALACDTCKANQCRPGEDLWVPRALELLTEPDPDLRAAAIDALGPAADHRPEVARALATVAGTDRDRGLRGMARRHLVQVPG